jgi:hypothetical protein
MPKTYGENGEATFRLPRTLPTALVAGALSGIIGGLAVGAIIGREGAVLGVGLGLVIGMIAGKVIEKEDRLQARRTKELDAIIGVTEGSLGAGDVPLVPSDPAPELPGGGEGWLQEWLTPPPPAKFG